MHKSFISWRPPCAPKSPFRYAVYIQIFRFEKISDVVAAFVFFFCFITIFCFVLKTQQHKFMNWQCDLEYRGSDFTSAVTLGNPDVLLGSGLFHFKVQLKRSLLSGGTMQILAEDKDVRRRLQCFDCICCICCNLSVSDFLWLVCRHFGCPLSSVHHTGTSSGWWTGLPPEAWRGRNCHLIFGEICRSNPNVPFFVFPLTCHSSKVFQFIVIVDAFFCLVSPKTI